MQYLNICDICEQIDWSIMSQILHKQHVTREIYFQI